MTNYLFAGSAEGWAGTDFTFVSDDGDPAPGCLNRTGSFGTALVSITGLSIDVSSNFYLGFRTKYAGILASIGGGAIKIVAKDGSNNVMGTVAFFGGNPGVVEGVWMEGFDNFATTATVVVTLEMSVIGSGNSLTDVWFDSVYIAEIPPVSGPFDFIQSAGAIPGSIMVST